jgi:hypothetical protein
MPSTNHETDAEGGKQAASNSVPQLTEEQRAAAQSPTIEGAPEVTDIDSEAKGLP